MADKNILTLVGRIGSRIKEGKTITGGTYITFQLEIESRANATSTENNYHQLIPIMCFKKNVIDYVRRVNAHYGTMVIVFGFISTYTDELKGNTIKANGVNANEIYCVKTRLYEGEVAKEQNKK